MSNPIKKTESPRIFHLLKDFPKMPLFTIVAAAIFGIYHSVSGGNFQSAIVMWIFAWTIIVPYFPKDLSSLKRKNFFFKTAAFVFLIFSCMASADGMSNLALYLIFLSLIAYFSGAKMLALTITPIAIWVFGCQNAEYIHYWASYPLRIICAQSAAAMLSLFGWAASAMDTLISIDGKQIAVTSACSGIDQLEALALIAWIVAATTKKNTLVRICYFLSLVPILILLNSTRLAITIAGVTSVGDIFLSEEIHTILGLIVVILSVGLFMLAGLLFPSQISDTNANDTPEHTCVSPDDKKNVKEQYDSHCKTREITTKQTDKFR